MILSPAKTTFLSIHYYYKIAICISSLFLTYIYIAAIDYFYS